MGALMRGHDWSASPLGPPEQWPQSLRSVVALMLNSRYPMFVAWGPELAFLYNDGYVPIFGRKHPHTLGLPFREVWPEIWDDIAPLIERALAGEATYHENLHLVMERNGFPEDTWYSFSYSPVRDDSGAIAGMFCACTETTSQIHTEDALRESEKRQAFLLTLSDALRPLTVPAEIAGLAAERLGEEFGLNRVFYAEFHGSLMRVDRDYTRDVCSIAGEHDLEAFGPELLGAYRDGAVVIVEDVGTDPRFSDDARAGLGARQVGAYVDVVLAEEEQCVSLLAVQSATPRSWAPAEVSLFREVGERIRSAIERARGEQALRAGEDRQAFLLKLSDALRAQPNEDAIGDRVLRMLAEKLELDRCYATAMYPAEDRVDVIQEVRHPDLTPMPSPLRFSDFPEAGERTFDRTLVFDDTANDPDLTDTDKSSLAAMSFGALLSSPVRQGEGNPIWALGAVSSEPRRWTPGEVALMEEATERTWAAMERARAEAALRESEERYRQIVEGAEDFAIVALDEHGIITAWNSGAERLIGFSAAEAIEQPGAIFFTLEDREAGVPDHEMNRARSDGRVVNERWHVRKNGSRFWGSGLMMRLDEEGGGYLKIFRDRTVEHEAEGRRVALVELGDAFRDLQEPADIAFASAEILGRTLGVSRVGYGRIDHDAETMHVERDWTLPGVGSLAGTLNLRDFGSFVDAMKLGELDVICDVRKDDRASPAEAAALEARSARSFVDAPVLERGRLVAVFFVNHAEARDWSEGDLALIQEFAERTRTAVERARGEAALRESEEQLRLIADSLPVLISRMGPDLRYRFVNRAYEDWFGVSRDEIIGRSVPELVGPDAFAMAEPAIRRVLAGERLSFEQTMPYRQGTRHTNIEFVPALAPDGSNDGWYALIQDISEAKRAAEKLAELAGSLEQRVAERTAELTEAQDALRQSQKMEAMGQLTGGVAHDFNNLLTPIVGSLDLLQRRQLGGEREQRLIQGALESAEKARTLVQRLLAFARRQPLHAEAVDVAALVKNMGELVASTTGPQIEVVIDAAADTPLARADVNQLEMAILNLSVNARDSMPDGGTLRISAKVADVDAGHRSGLPAADYVCISVADTGKGMDQQTLSRAIEPFFSTKGLGKGTGLGLSMVHGLASQLGGALTISSQPGVGTNVELWLPVAEGALGNEPTALLPAGLPRMSGKALLVDDEPLVRASTADMLGEMGYDVVQAESGEQALELIADGLTPDLVVTDQLMPGMSGTELIGAIRDQQPDVPVLIVSGYADVDGIAPGLPRLAKPFRRDDLDASIAALTNQ